MWPWLLNWYSSVPGEPWESKVEWRGTVFLGTAWALLGAVFQMEQKQVVPPFKPNISGEFGLDNFDSQFTNEPVQLTPDDE